MTRDPMSFSDHAVAEQTVQEHVAIAGNIAARDPAGAAAMMEGHLRRVYAHVLSRLEAVRTPGGEFRGTGQRRDGTGA